MDTIYSLFWILLCAGAACLGVGTLITAVTGRYRHRTATVQSSAPFLGRPVTVTVSGYRHCGAGAAEVLGRLEARTAELSDLRRENTALRRHAQAQSEAKGLSFYTAEELIEALTSQTGKAVAMGPVGVPFSQWEVLSYHAPASETDG